MDLKLAEAAKRADVSTEVMRNLVDAGLIKSQPGERGHRTVRLEDVPTRHRIVELWQQHYRLLGDRALSAMQGLEAELESVRLDVVEAIENPAAPLGNDLRLFGSTDGAYQGRVREAIMATLALSLAHRTMTRLRDEGPRSRA